MKKSVISCRAVALTGFKGSGKSRIGKMLAKKLEMDYLDIDSIIVKAHSRGSGERQTVRAIYRKYGADYFQKLELKAIRQAAKKSSVVLSLGGGTPLNGGFRKSIFKKGTRFVHLSVKPAELYKRILKKGLPPFFDKKSPRKSFTDLLAKRRPVYEKLADFTVDNTNRKPAECVAEIMEKLGV